jgi:hypothetical protein
MTRLLFLLLITGKCSLALPAYLSYYKQESEFAISFYSENKGEFDQAARKTGLSAAFIFSIVAPELSQYHLLSDYAQVYALKVLYVQGGKAYGNFSVGLFQMSPSFIETLESQIANNHQLKELFPELLIPGNDKSSRAQRIQRLEDKSWQIKYLTAFCLLVKDLYPKEVFSCEQEALQFFAAVYNIGFRSYEDIIRIRTIPVFPRFGILKFCYSKVANEFFNKLNHNML